MRANALMSMRSGPTWEQAFERTRPFELHENAEVINVAPEAVLDPRGGFLVTDDREAQLRRYGRDGTLLWNVGRRGGGPGEFEAPTAVVRLGSGEVAAFDRGGRVTVFDSAGGTVLRTFATELRHISDAAALDGASVLVAGIVEGHWEAPRLHVVDTRTGAIGARFFAPFRSSPNPVVATFAGWTKVSVRGDTVAAIFATSDTLYRFTTDGHRLPPVAIPFPGFRRPTARVPDNANRDATARMRWLSSFDLVADVHWLRDGSVLVPWQNFDEHDGTTRHWHLLRMTPAGRRVETMREVPRLLEVDRETSSLYFLDPAAEAPNRWIEAQLRR